MQLLSFEFNATIKTVKIFH